MGSRPEELRSEIEQTRDELAYDVDRLADHTVPSRVVGRKWEGVKGRARTVADKVMGARDTAQDKASGAGSKFQEKASQAGDKVQETAQSVAGTVRDAPGTVARQTRGNPLAAGVIAFGVGLLAASLLPETEAEKRAGAAVADRSEGLVEKAKEAGREIADELGGTAREAAQQVKETARDAAGHTAEQAKESGRTTVEQTRQSVN
jgi:hypothetical protein